MLPAPRQPVKCPCHDRMTHRPWAGRCLLRTHGDAFLNARRAGLPALPQKCVPCGSTLSKEPALAATRTRVAPPLSRLRCDGAVLSPSDALIEAAISAPPATPDCVLSPRRDCAVALSGLPCSVPAQIRCRLQNSVTSPAVPSSVGRRSCHKRTPPARAEVVTALHYVSSLDMPLGFLREFMRESEFVQFVRGGT